MPVLYNVQDNRGTNIALNMDELFNPTIKHNGFLTPEKFLEAIQSPNPSPIKKQYENTILKEIIKLEVTKRNQNQLIIEEILNKQRRLAELIAIYKKEQQHKRETILENEAFNEWYLETEAKIIQENIQNNSGNASDIMLASYNKIIENYIEQHAVLNEILASKNEELSQLGKEEDAMESQYNHYEKEHNLLEQQLIHQKPDLTDIRKRIDALTSIIDKDTNVITKLVDDGNYEAAAPLIQRQNARNLQVGVLKNLAGFIEGTHIAYDANGNVTKSYFDSEFIVDKNQKISGTDKAGNSVEMTMNDKKIVKVDNEYYLINKNTSTEELAKSPELKHKAKRDFDKMENTIKTIKKLIPENKKRASIFLSERKDKLHTEMQEIMKQLSKLESAKARVIKMASDIKEGKASLNTMDNPATPSISSSTNLTAVSNRILVNTLSMVRSVKVNEKNNSTIILENQAQPHLDMLKQDIGTLLNDKNLAAFHPGLRLAYQNLVGPENSGTGQIIPGAPISPIRMSRILEGLNRFGVDANLPGMQGITQLEELAKEAAAQRGDGLWNDLRQMASQELKTLNTNASESTPPSITKDQGHQQEPLRFKKDTDDDTKESTKENDYKSPSPLSTSPKINGG